jgi:uncharacterized protein YaeQ
MALPSTLFRFRIELSDIDRGVYEPLDFRVAMHPSESPLYLISRVLAFALNAQQDLEFSPQGLGDPDVPCLRVADPRGGTKLWIEIGSPSARRLHMAAKAAQKVRIYTYKDPKVLMEEINSSDIHRVEQLDIFSFAPEFLQRLVDRLGRNNEWSLVHTEGSLTVNFGNESEQGEIRQHSVL